MCIWAWTRYGKSNVDVRAQEVDLIASKALGTLDGGLWQLVRENPENAFWPVFNPVNELLNPDDNWWSGPETDVINRVFELACSK